MAHAEQKFRFFAWLVLHGRIVISNNLALKRWPHDLICKLCGLQPETVQHLLLDCTFTVAVCEKIFEWKGLLGLVPPHLGGGINAWWYTTAAGIPKERRCHYLRHVGNLEGEELAHVPKHCFSTGGGGALGLGGDFSEGICPHPGS
jgi:hypothetical protein